MNEPENGRSRGAPHTPAPRKIDSSPTATRHQGSRSDRQVEPSVRDLPDDELRALIDDLGPRVHHALATPGTLPRAVEDARSRLAACRIELRRREAGRRAAEVGARWSA